MTDEEQGQYVPDSVAEARINLGQVIQGLSLFLITDMSVVNAGIKFRNLTPKSFQDFFEHFLALFLTAYDHLAPETVKPIETFFDQAAELATEPNMSNAAQEALKLALRMKQDLVALGLWTIFSPVGEPPFMNDEIL